MDLIEVGVVSDIGQEISPVCDLVIGDAELVHDERDCGLLNGALGKRRWKFGTYAISLVMNRSEILAQGTT